MDIIDDKDLQAPLQLARNYNQLADSFEDVAVSATKVSKELETGTQSTQSHRDASNQLGKAQKDLDRANEKAAASQKKYAEATAHADKLTGGMVSRVKDLGKQFIVLLANPVVLFLTAIAGALASIGLYFKSTNDGADKFEKIMNQLNGVVDFFSVKIVKLGEELVKMFEGGSALGTIFSAVFDQIVNRISGVLDGLTSVVKIINILSSGDLTNLKAEFVKLGQAGLQAMTGIGTAADELGEKLKSLGSLTEAADKLGDETRDRILSKAQSLLDIEQQLFIFKDKANHTDKQRVDALQKAVQISEDQLKIDIDLATRRERLFTAELLHKKGIINSETEANKVLAHGTTLLQDQLLEHQAIDDELEQRRKLQADVLNLQTTFFAENKKNIAQLGALQKEIDEAAIARAQKETDIRVALFDKQIQAAKEVSGQEILGLKSSLGEQEEVHQRFNQRLVDETKLRLKQQKDAEKQHAKEMADELKRQENERKAIIEASFAAISLVSTAYFENRRSALTEESEQVEENRKRALAGAEGDAVKQLAINRKFDREQAKIKLKQAQADKQQALFNILISTAAGIARVAPNPVLIALVAAIGGVQAGLVAARPLPKFWKGTQNAPANFIAGDRGRELVQRNGESFIADRPTIFTDMAGAKVFTKQQTDNILGTSADIGHALNYGSRVKHSLASNTVVADRLKEGNRLLNKIANKREQTLVIDEDGFRIYSGKMARRNEEFYKRFKGW